MDLVDSPGYSAWFSSTFFSPQLLAVRAMYFPSRRSLVTFPPIYFLRLVSTGCVSWFGFILLNFFPPGLHRQPFCIQPAPVFWDFVYQGWSTSCACTVRVEQDMRTLVCTLWIGGFLDGNLETAACWQALLNLLLIEEVILSCKLKQTEIVFKRKLVTLHRTVFGCACLMNFT